MSARSRYTLRLVIGCLWAVCVGNALGDSLRTLSEWIGEPYREAALREGCGLPACPVCYPHRHPETPDYSEDTLRGHNDD